jgi:DNA-binding NtrC family response regulator
MSEAAVMAPGAGEMSSSCGSVLIIDDEAAIRESLETLLTWKATRWKRRNPPKKAWRGSANEAFDLVLLDLASA